MRFKEVSLTDPRIFGKRVVQSDLLFEATQLRVPAISFGDEDPLSLSLPDNPDGAGWTEKILNLPPCYRYRLADAVVHPPTGVITIDDFVLTETLSHLPIHLPGYARDSDGVSLPAASINASVAEALHVMGGNYQNPFHILGEILTRLQIEPLFPYPFDGTILMPPMATVAQRDLMMRLAAVRRPIYLLDGRQAIHAKSLLFIRDPIGSGYTPNPGLAPFFDRMKSLLDVTEAPVRRIYVSRKDTKNRELINEEEVIATVQRSGFEVVEMSRLNLREQARSFASASHIIAPHGAGLVNLVFCNSGIRLCELQTNAYVKWHFRRLGAIRNVDYGCLLGKAELESSQRWPHASRWSISIDKLEATLANPRFREKLSEPCRAAR